MREQRQASRPQQIRCPAAPLAIRVPLPPGTSAATGSRSCSLSRRQAPPATIKPRSARRRRAHQADPPRDSRMQTSSRSRTRQLQSRSSQSWRNRMQAQLLESTPQRMGAQRAKATLPNMRGIPPAPRIHPSARLLTLQPFSSRQIHRFSPLSRKQLPAQQNKLPASNPQRFPPPRHWLQRLPRNSGQM